MSRITDNSLITLQIGVNLSTSAFNDKITITSSFDGVDIDYGIQNVLYSVDFKYKKFNSYAITLNTKTFKTSS